MYGIRSVHMVTRTAEQGGTVTETAQLHAAKPPLKGLLRKCSATTPAQTHF
jgi:hypothetical protein